MKKIIIISVLGFFCLKVSAQGTVNGHEYVDLGLPSGLKWATCNVGATSPEDYGDYYDYDDALEVPKSWGDNFRLPTNNEFYELINSCTWTWIKQNDVDGYKVTGPNGGSIFLPAAGEVGRILFGAGEYGCYWSSTPNKDYSEYRIAYHLMFDGDEYIVDHSYCFFVISVRLVSE